MISMPRTLSSNMSIYKKKVWQIAFYEKLALDAGREKAQETLHLKLKKLLTFLAGRRGTEVKTTKCSFPTSTLVGLQVLDIHN